MNWKFKGNNIIEETDDVAKAYSKVISESCGGSGCGKSFISRKTVTEGCGMSSGCGRMFPNEKTGEKAAYDPFMAKIAKKVAPVTTDVTARTKFKLSNILQVVTDTGAITVENKKYKSYMAFLAAKLNTSEKIIYNFLENLK